MTIKNGIYKCNPEGAGGDVTVSVRETKNSFIMELVKNTCHFSPGHIDMLFWEHGYDSGREEDKRKAIINKRNSKHAMRFIDGCNDWFVIYPFKAGIPFAFELVK